MSRNTRNTRRRSQSEKTRGNEILKQLKDYSNKFAIIELDDIDDPIALKMLDTPKYFKLLISKKESDFKNFLHFRTFKTPIL